MSASEWFGEITNPESIAAITAAATAISGIVYTFGRVFIKLYKDVKSGKKTLLDAFKEGFQKGQESVIQIESEIKKLDMDSLKKKKSDKKSNRNSK